MVRLMNCNKNEGNDDNEDKGDSPFRKYCGPGAILVIALVIALSQLQLAFETVAYYEF